MKFVKSDKAETRFCTPGVFAISYHLRYRTNMMLLRVIKSQHDTYVYRSVIAINY